MRTLVLFAVLATASAAQAQNVSSEMQVTLPEVDVRSGPTEQYYVTSTLKMNDTVTVLHESEQQKGWYAIKPPPKSFSWINQKNVQALDARTGLVISEEAPLRPGSFINTKDAKPVISVTIKRGSIVKIVAQGKQFDGETWLPIEPWITEVRFIKGDALLKRTNGGGPVPAQLASLSQNQWSPGLAPQTSQANAWPPAQPVSFSQNNSAAKAITYAPNWSPVGKLRAAFVRDGQQTYYLEDLKDRRLLMYVTCAPGLTLRDYVGRTVSIYGSTIYRGDDALRTYYLQGTNVAWYK